MKFHAHLNKHVFNNTFTFEQLVVFIFMIGFQRISYVSSLFSFNQSNKSKLPSTKELGDEFNVRSC